ncbi:hypothetical protein [Bifidobacterium sp. ESL0790]|uniref:hypothetical protein n=1 Tax=Bifidobacterium sp. ESL0790 TaxID=2983233 RepID=UPI0023F862E2|nr:hypothetical protein [Bifidobacterium sp. ESL0790]WEV71676.1 hypothetical protein OZY47_04170 [Bifidobacterium sp. ESL0790]
MSSEDLVPEPDDKQSVEVIQDGQELMVFGDNSAVDAWLKSEGLDKETQRNLDSHALQACGNGIQALADAKQQSGRWVKLTKESADQTKKFGPTGTGVLRNEHGQIVHHLKFEDMTKVTSKVNPQMLADIGGVMTQMALQQSMDEIEDCLKKIDGKIDDLLQDQKDQTLANLMGAAQMIGETKTIRDKVGTLSDTTWSKIEDCPRDLASAQSYALIKIRNLTKKLPEKIDAKDDKEVIDQLLRDTSDWLAVIGQSIQSQNELYILELDRVMTEQPEEVERYREGINEARRQRLHGIQGELSNLSKDIQGLADTIRDQKVKHPRTVEDRLDTLQSTNKRLSTFAKAIGVDADYVEIEMAPHWTDAVGKLITENAVEIGENAKQIGSGAVKLGKGAGQKIGEGAELVGDYAGQFNENLKEGRSKLTEKLAEERAKDAAKPKQKLRGLFSKDDDAEDAEK